MNIFDHIEFDEHEHISLFSDKETGLKAIVAVHDTTLGPALGGCRMFAYQNDQEALTDVLRLSQGMTYKSALAGLALGGGKSVIIADPKADKTPALLEAFGRKLNDLGGIYIGAEDVGTTVADMQVLHGVTQHVAGLGECPSLFGTPSNGDPSPATAYGVFVGIQSAAAYALDRKALSGLKVAVQGLGSVGMGVVKHLREAGAEVWGCDVDERRVAHAVEQWQLKPVALDEIYGLDVDVFCPCAMGGILNDHTVPQLRAKIVAGGANNQLWTPEHGQQLKERGICYAPDFVINAGGIIDISYQRGAYQADVVKTHVEKIATTLHTIFTSTEHGSRTESEVAIELAQACLAKARAKR